VETTTAATTTATTTSTTTELRPFGVAFGGNLGDVRGAISAALERLSRHFGPLRVAPLYRTEPVSAIPQSPFLNTVAVGATDRTPEALLAAASEIELALGRRRARRGAPRTIDVDLLFVGSELRSGPELELPHPRLRDRRFVMAPLADLIPSFPLPPDGRPVRELLAELPDRPWVVRLHGPEER